MILQFDNYKIKTDERQFIVQRKKIIQDSKFTKTENVGKEVWEDYRYYSSLETALKFLGKSVLLQNDDVVVIKAKIDELQGKIEEFIKVLTVTL